MRLRNSGGNKLITVAVKAWASSLKFNYGGATTTSFATRLPFLDGIPLLSKEGQPRSGGVVCSKRRSHLIDAREALLLLIGTVVFEQTAPALAMRGHPRLTKAGNNFANLSRKCL